MPNVLLTGAGFSNNWGGWLASEAFEYLLGAQQIDNHLRSVLWTAKNAKGGFEDALGTLQVAFESNPSKENKEYLDRLTVSLIEMFEAMNKAFATTRFEFGDNDRMEFKRFLALFDAIFTLNQDTLLESHYLGPVRWSEAWAGSYIPGMDVIDREVLGYRFPLQSPMTLGTYQESSENQQPYFKLHGSSNWFAEPLGRRMLIMGTNKDHSIAGFNVLARYMVEFEKMLLTPETRLIVIGYSFGDKHINDAIDAGISRETLKLFIVDPLGVDILDKRAPNEAISDARTLRDKWFRGIYGASRRSLRSIFTNDRVEHDKLFSFFDQSAFRTRISRG